MQDYKLVYTLVVNKDRFSLNQYSKNNFEVKNTDDSLCVRSRKSNIYLGCMQPDITYVTRILGIYISNPGVDHWKAVKRVLRYLQRTKDYMLTYWRSDQLEIIGCINSNFAA